MLEMNPEIREQWCKALRSGEYNQTTKALRNTAAGNPERPIGYCCLGVLTDLYLKAGNPETYEERDEDGQPGGIIFKVWDEAVLSQPVVEWAGLSSDNPALEDPIHGRATAAEWNDDLAAGFNKIADMIDGGQQG